jgi:cyclic pyranopterin phosphate synthase
MKIIPNESRATSTLLDDKYGRKLNSLRISLTQRCNLDCFFCHKEGQTASSDELATEEIGKIARIACELGMRKIKLTGGEPLLRDDLPDIIREIADYADEVSLTTNGVLLEKQAKDLRDAGLKRVNVSLCSTSLEGFRRITKKDCVLQVKNGIRAALQSGLFPVKINMVVLKGVNVHEIPKAIDFAQETGTILQLIEFQPVQRENALNWESFHYDLTSLEEGLKEKAVSIEENPLHKRRRYCLRRKGGLACVEIVHPMHNSEFCRNCTRLRVTSEGKLKPCLLRNDNLVDIALLVRHGAELSELKEAFKKAALLREPYWRKESEDQFESAREILPTIKDGQHF